MNVSEMCAEAAVLVRTHGLWKKDEKPTGGFCLLSALYQVRVDARADESVERQAVATVVRYLGLRDAMAAYQWNDAPERTAEEVAVALEVAGLIAGAQAQPVRAFEVAR